MAINIVEVEDVRSGRGGRSKGEKYGKYATAIQKHIPWIEDEIEKAKGHVIRIKNEDMRKELGGEFIKKNDTTVYWGLKYVMFQDGIVVEQGTHKDGGSLLIFRSADEKDVLPPSLAKYLEPDENGESGEAGESVIEDLEEKKE